jgi:hypothetical protein
MGVSLELLLLLLLQFFIAVGFGSEILVGCYWSEILLPLLDSELDPVKIQWTTNLRILISNKDFC